jgi:hypothetical protein
MITREEAIWLFRCVLGRDPETEVTIENMMRLFPSFAEARRHVIESSEFRTAERLRNRAFAANRALDSMDFVRTLDERIGGGSASRVYLDHPGRLFDDRQGAVPYPVIEAIADRIDLRLILVLGRIADHPWLLTLLATQDRAWRAAAILSIPGSVELSGEGQRSVLGGSRSALGGSRSVPGGSRSALGGPKNALGGSCHFNVGATVVFHLQVEMHWTLIFPMLAKAGFEPDIVVATTDSPDDMMTIVEESLVGIHQSGLILIKAAADAKDGGNSAVRAAVHKIFQRDWVVAGDYFLIQNQDWQVPITRLPPPRWTVAGPCTPAPEPSLPETLGLACIVKNEARFIAGMLHSCIPIASFVLVVDTGSTDATLDIVREVLTAAGRPFRIIETDFVDFATARNVAVDNMPDWIQWTLMMDADEHLVMEDYERFGPLMTSRFDGWKLPRYNFVDMAKLQDPTPYPDHQTRLFRNTPARLFRYFGIVHEYMIGVPEWGIAPSNLTAVGGDEGGPHIHHMGEACRRPEERPRKIEFYARLIERMEAGEASPGGGVGLPVDHATG